MKRIILMFLRNFFYSPIMLIRLHYYGKHADKYDTQFLYDYTRSITFHALKGGKVHVNVEGKENIPTDQNFIFYPNHQGFFDVLSIIAVNPVPISVVYKKELSNVPFLKGVFRCLHARAIDREDIRQSLTVINDMAKDVKEGRNYLIFAEGTRSRNGNEILPFKGGSFKAAYKSQCMVAPVALIDTYKVFDIGDTKEITVKVKFLPPIPYEEYKEMKSTELATVVHDRIEQAIHEEEASQPEHQKSTDPIKYC